MTTTQKLGIAFLLMVVGSVVYGQEPKYKSRGIYRDTIAEVGNVSILDISTFADRNVFSYQDNDSTQIVIPREEFMEALEKKVTDQQIDWDIELLQKLKSLSEVNLIQLDTLNAGRSRVKYIVARLLEGGKCGVTYQFSNERITNLIKFKFLENNNTGRRFFTDKKVIVLETYDGVF